MKNLSVFFLLLFGVFSQLLAQTPLNRTSGVLQDRGAFSHADSLRGALNPNRACFDVTFYDLNMAIDIGNRSLKGYNEISFRAVKAFKTIQLDLFAQFSIDSIIYNGQKLSHKRDSAAFLINFNQKLEENTAHKLRVYYSGKPKEAAHAPWDGGFVWRKDQKGKPWVGVACEGHGASSWWPLKDHLSDEPDSMRMAFTIPEQLYCVSNGTLRSTTNSPDGKTKTFEWFVHYPINSYNVTLNIGDYSHLGDTFKQADGSVLELDYYVLSYNLEKAKAHFNAQVPKMLACFERYFGQYPFPKDGYALVETQYWGMEHQGAIAYGNHFNNNEWQFDYIIIHETGHEWFGNNISVADHADMWIHESFTTYAEALFIECRDGKEKAVEYLLSQRGNIRNEDAVLGPLDVNFDGWKGSDMYYKGSWMLQTLRSVVDNDPLWFATLKKMNVEFKYKIVDTKQVVDFFNRELGKDYTPIFTQYLAYKDLPTFDFKFGKKGKNRFVEYRWKADVPKFAMPVVITITMSDGKTIVKRLDATTDFKKEKLEGKAKPVQLKVDEGHFYVLPFVMKVEN